MPFNFRGDLKKREIVVELQKRGLNVNSVQKLNLILQEMGIQRKSGNDWLLLQEGYEYTIWDSPIFNAEGWHPFIVDAICEYFKE